MRHEEHLLHREGGDVYMETTFITQLLRRDGKADATTLSYSRDDMIQTWVQNYLDADMVSLITRSDICYFLLIETYGKNLEKSLLLHVFLSINIEKYHWYLARCQCFGRTDTCFVFFWRKYVTMARSRLHGMT